MIINVLNTWCVLFEREILLQQKCMDTSHASGTSNRPSPKKYIIVLL